MARAIKLMLSPAGGIYCLKRLACVQNNCGLQFGNEELTFTSCQNFQETLGKDMNVLWTVRDDGNGNSTLRAAIDGPQAANEIDWFGFGFNPTLEMIGGDALIVKTCSSCSSGEVVVVNGQISHVANFSQLSLSIEDALRIVCFKESSLYRRPAALKAVLHFMF